MSTSRFNVAAYLNRPEGQHFERKSLQTGPPAAKKPRNRKEVRDAIAENVAAFANAEGGVLILGLEDDGEVSGHSYSPEVVDVMLQVPGSRLEPGQPAGFRCEVEGKELLVFEVPMASGPVLVTGNGYPLRMGDRTVRAKFEAIQKLKVRGLLESYEAQPSGCTLDDLDPALLARAQTGAGLGEDEPAEYLVRRRLADWRGPTLVLRQAAELLFRKGLSEHPNAGVRIFRVVGRERRMGREHNVEELPRIEGPLPGVLETTFKTITGLLRRPSRLNREGLFEPTWEYPEFSWKEAVLNAVAHRDYAVQGRGVEVWLFDDRFEVTSPGGLVEGVSLEKLLTLERIHMSRNPRLVRALVDLGFMRDQGEGLPRMFAEMQSHFLPRPELAVPGGDEVKVVLYNTPTLTEEDHSLLESLQDVELSRLEFLALLEASRHGKVDNARIRAISDLDTLGASKLLRGLRDRGFLDDHGRGSATHYTIGSEIDTAASSTLSLFPDAGAGAESHKPEAEGRKLGSGSSRSDGEKSKNELQTDEPEQEHPKLGEEHPKPGEEHPKPGEEHPKPGEEQPKLGEQQHRLDQEQPKLGEQQHRLDQEQPKLGEQQHRLDQEPPETAEKRTTGSQDISAAIRGEIEWLRRRRDPLRLQKVVEHLCRQRPWTKSALASILGRHPRLIRAYLREMVADGRLRLLYPDTPSHPQQAYVAPPQSPDTEEPL